MKFAVLLASIFLFLPGAALAQELVPDVRTTMKAKVLEVVSSEERQIPGTDVMGTNQVIRVVVLDGAEAGKYITVQNDFLNLKENQVFYLTRTTNSAGGEDYYEVAEPYRLPQLGLLVLFFIGVVVVFGGRQGIRGLLALAGSLFCIVFLLLPGVLHGYPPILIAVGVASFIIVLGSYITHGFNRTTTTAVIGMITTVSLTGLLAYVAIPFAELSGLTNDETLYLNINLRGAIDLAGLLIGGILIGTLGVLYDAAIGQSVSVEELSRAGSHLSRGEIYRRALRIGREHIGALVNTLAIAYVGASLPLLLLFYGFSVDSILVTINRELFATEIVRTVIGSIGIVLTVPITTAIAVYMLVGSPRRDEVEAGRADRSGSEIAHHY